MTNEEVQIPQAVPDNEISEMETPPSAPPDPPNTTANEEKPMEPPGEEIIPEQETEPEHAEQSITNQ